MAVETLETVKLETIENLVPASPDASPSAMHPEFAAIYDTHSRPIYYLALRLLSDPSQAEDATHDVFVKAFRKIREFRGDADIRTWLYRITLNHCSNLRQSWHARNVDEEAIGSDPNS